MTVDGAKRPLEVRLDFEAEATQEQETKSKPARKRARQSTKGFDAVLKDEDQNGAAVINTAGKSHALVGCLQVAFYTCYGARWSSPFSIYSLVTVDLQMG